MSDEGGILLDEVVERPESGEGSVNSSALNGEAGTSTSPDDYMRLLAAERTTLELQSPGCSLAMRLLAQELERVQSTGRISREEKRTFADITKEKPIKVSVRVLVPIREHPKFNFVGKLLGPKGNSLKRLQEETMTKMAILGRGSMRDKQKEEELRGSNDPKFSHLSDDLHVEVTAFAPPAEAHARIAYALAEIRRFLVPDYNDEIRQEQMWEMQLLKNRQRRSGGSESGTGAEGECGSSSEVSSNGSPSPPPPPIDSSSPNSGKGSPQQHPAMRGVSARSQQQLLLAGIPALVPGSPSAANAVVTGSGNPPLLGRKRPLLSGGARLTMSPTKRTVLSILTRARAAQAKDGVGPDYDLTTCASNGGCRLDENLSGNNGGASAV